MRSAPKIRNCPRLGRRPAGQVAPRHHPLHIPQVKSNDSNTSMALEWQGMSATLEVKHNWCVSTWMGDHLGTVSSWSAEHCGVTGQCKDSGVGNRGTHLFLCNGKEMSLCPAHASCKTTHHLSKKRQSVFLIVA